MEIKCPACQSGFRIPREKLPADKKVIAFPCPKCSHPLTVNLKEEHVPDQPTEQKTDPTGNLETQKDDTAEMMEGLSQEAYDASEKPFDFVHVGQRTALICESDPENRQKVRQVLENMEFRCAEAESTLKALKQMRYHTFDLIFLNENFDKQARRETPLRVYLSRLPMATRRNIFVVLLSRRFRTMDNMAAFNLSVNQVVHEKDIDDLEKIIGQGIAENDAFYAVLKEALDSVGEITPG